MYNGLTPLFDNVDGSDLPSYFKSERLEPELGRARGDRARPPGPADQARRLQRPAHLRPDRRRRDLRRRLRDGRGPQPAPQPGPLQRPDRGDRRAEPVGDQPDHRLYQFEPTAQTNAIVERQTDVIRAAGPKGEQLLRDIDTYLDGHQRVVRGQPARRRAPFTRVDIYAINAIKGQFLGQGGGAEPLNSEFLDGLRSRFGTRRAAGIFEDLRARNDPDTDTTLSTSAPYQATQPTGRGAVVLQRRLLSSRCELMPAQARVDAAEPGVEHPHGLGAALDHRPAAVRRRAADRLLLPRPHLRGRPARPEHRDAAA